MSAEGLHDELELDAGAALLVDSLSPSEASRFYTLLEQARTAETDDIDTAVDAMVSAIPSVARGRIRRMLRRDGR